MHFIMYGLFCFNFHFALFSLYFSSHSLSPCPLLWNSPLIPLESLGATSWSDLEKRGWWWRIRYSWDTDRRPNENNLSMGQVWSHLQIQSGVEEMGSQWREMKAHSVHSEVEVGILKLLLSILGYRRTWLVGLMSAFSAA